MRRQRFNQFTAWRATVSEAAVRLRRPRVTAILCRYCDTWVKPRRYDPTVYACKGCAPKAAYDYYRARRAAADLAIAQQRAYEKDIRQWRREAAAQRRQHIAKAE